MNELGLMNKCQRGKNYPPACMLILWMKTWSNSVAQSQGSAFSRVSCMPRIQDHHYDYYSWTWGRLRKFCLSRWQVPRMGQLSTCFVWVDDPTMKWRSIFWIHQQQDMRLVQVLAALSAILESARQDAEWRAGEPARFEWQVSGLVSEGRWRSARSSDWQGLIP